MADDPFAEFQQVEEKKVELEDNPPEAVSNYLEKERKLLERPSNFNHVSKCFAPEFRPTAEKHFMQRQKYYAKLRAKEDEIEAIMERLYIVRHDKSRPEKDALQDVKNLLAELTRLQEELTELRDRGLGKFTESLELDELGISKRPKAASFIDPSKSNVNLELKAKSGMDLGRISSRSGAYGFMKTSSTVQGFERQSPNEKWFSLFRMFKEWRYQKNMAEAQRLAMQAGDMGEPTTAAGYMLLQEEKNKLRAAILMLNQRKNRSPADDNLLEVLQAKLKALNAIPC